MSFAALCRLLRFLPLVVVGLLNLPVTAFAQTNADFNVTVNTGPVAPNAATVYPGESTSLRVTLSNNSIVSPITNVSYSGSLPVGANASLVVDGVSTISPGACGGSITTTPGSSAVDFSGITIPVRDPIVAGSGECYIDLPVRGVSTDGQSTTLSYAIAADEVSATGGGNATGGNQAITLRAASRPSIAKSFTPNNLLIIGGAARTLRLTVTNTDSNVDLTGVAFSDVFPTAGVDGAVMEPTGTPATGSCVTGGASVILVQGVAARVDANNISVSAGGSCVIDVEVQARHSNGVYQSNQTNRIEASSVTSDQGLTPASDATASVRVRSPLAIEKSFSPVILASGEQGQFTITMTNNGSVGLDVSSFVDDPIGTPDAGNLSIGGTGDIANSCGGSSALESGGEGFSVSGFTIPGGGSCTITVTYTGVVGTSETPVVYTNSIPQGAVQISNITGIVSEQESATVIVADRLRILKSGNPGGAAPGQAVEYQITVQNFSASPISNVSVADTLQNGSSLLLGGAFDPTLSAACGALQTNGAVQGDTAIDFTIPTLPARTGASSPGECIVSFWVMIDPLATTATENVLGAGDVCFNPGGGEICNGGSSNTVSTSLRSPVSFLKSIDGTDNASRLEGVPARLRLEIQNRADAPLDSVAFSDTLPSAGPFQQLRIATPANVSNSCGGTVTAVAGSTSLALNGGTVAAYVGGVQGVCAVEVDIIGPAGSYPNTAQATGNRPNADGSNTSLGVLEDSATINYTPALQSSKLFTPDSTGSNSTSTLEIRFENVDGSQPITGISATDSLPAGMVVATPANAYTTCAGPVVLTATEGASSISVSGATLAPSSNCAVLVDVFVTGTSNWVNTIPAGAITADNGIVNTTPVTATLTYVPPGVPLISKSITPGTIAPGQSATLEVTITNGAQDLTNVSLVDWFTLDGTAAGDDNGMLIAPTPLASTDCPGGVVTAMAEGNSLRLSGASLVSGASCTFEAQVTSERVGTIVNRIPMDSISSDQGATNTTSFAESSLSTTSDVGISKLFTPPVVGVGEPSRLKIEFFNGGTTAITGFALTDTYPAGLENAPTPNAITSCGGGAVLSFPTVSSIRIEGGSIAAATGEVAASCTVEVDVVASAEGAYRNTIPADVLTVEGLPIPHPPTENTLQVRERIVINKAFDDLTLDAGDPNGFTTGNAVRLPGVVAPLTIRLENPNEIPLTQVAFTDELPDGLTLAVPTNLATTCTDGVVTGVANGREVSLAGATLAETGVAGAICTVTVDVVSNVPGVYTNEIAAGDVTSFEGVDNDPGTQAQLVVSEPPTVSKEFLPPVIAPGATAQLRITLGNDNDVDGTLTANLVDTLPVLPGAMVVAPTPNVATDCPGGTGIVTAGAGAASITIASGAVIPAGGCSVTLDVTAPDPGDYVNTIPVGALQTTLGPNDTPTDAPLKLSTLGYISGKVFLDNQTVPDGAFIPGDSTPIAGDTLELRAGANCSGALLATTTTDAQGNYLFAELSAGTYSVCQPAQPGGTLNSVTTEGSIEPYAGSTGTVGVASNPTSTSSQVVGIVLNDNGNANEVSGSPDNNFSEVLPASLSGNVYFDANDDGVFDGGENGIGGVTIELSGPVTLTTTTAADGSWSFSGLPPGDYTVTEIQPGGWDDGQDTRGTVDGTPVGDDSLNDVISAIVLGPGDSGIDYNFGEIAPASFAVIAEAVCINNAPYVDYRLAGFSGASSPAVTVTWLTTGARVAEQLTNQPGSGRLLWPGATVDGSGNGTGWPGWAFVDGEWVEIPDDRIPDLEFEVSFKPTASVTVTYPPATAACAAQPAGTFRVAPVPVMPNKILLLLVISLLGAVTRYRPAR